MAKVFFVQVWDQPIPTRDLVSEQSRTIWPVWSLSCSFRAAPNLVLLNIIQTRWSGSGLFPDPREPEAEEFKASIDSFQASLCHRVRPYLKPLLPRNLIMNLSAFMHVWCMCQHYVEGQLWGICSLLWDAGMEIPGSLCVWCLLPLILRAAQAGLCLGAGVSVWTPVPSQWIPAHQVEEILLLSLVC